MAHELVHYMQECMEGERYVEGVITYEQVFELVQFGIKFQVQKGFWEMVEECLQTKVHQWEKNSNILMQVATMMQEEGVLQENTLHLILKRLVKNSNKLNIKEITFLLLVLSSEPALNFDGKRSSMINMG